MTQKRGRYYNTDPTPENFRALWDRLHDLSDQNAQLQTTIKDHEATFEDLNEQVLSAQRIAQQASINASLPYGVLRGSGAGGGGGVTTIPDYGAIVATTLATFNPVIPEADEEAGKAQLTRAAAWAIYQTDPNIGLLKKTSGNNVNGRSVDIVVQMTNGSFADVASSHNNGNGTVTILATWSAHPGDSTTSDETNWIVPTATIAAEAGPMAPA
jgi:hypothetical protein